MWKYNLQKSEYAEIIDKFFSRYGYKDQVCLQADVNFCSQADRCLGPHVPENYSTPCPLCERHCMNSHDENKVVDITMSIINKNINRDGK